MITVRVGAATGSQPALRHLATSLERRFSTARRRCRQEARVLLTARCLPGPVQIHPDRGVVVSTWESNGVCRYTGLTVEHYLFIASLVGVVQWRALLGNPLLKVEDFLHPRSGRCLFGGPDTVQDFALLLDAPRICRGCVDFYHCLGADGELVELRNAIGAFTREQPTALIPSRW